MKMDNTSIQFLCTYACLRVQSWKFDNHAMLSNKVHLGQLCHQSGGLTVNTNAGTKIGLRGKEEAKSFGEHARCM